MDDETSNLDQRKSNFCYSLEEEPGKKEPKKGISVTRALVMLGFDDWKDLEPGKLCYLRKNEKSLENKTNQYRNQRRLKF